MHPEPLDWEAFRLNGDEVALPVVEHRPCTPVEIRHPITALDLDEFAWYCQDMPEGSMEGIEIWSASDSIFLVVRTNAWLDDRLPIQEELEDCKQLPGIPIGSVLDVVTRVIMAWEPPTIRVDCIDMQWVPRVITGSFQGKWVKAVELRLYLELPLPLHDEITTPGENGVRIMIAEPGAPLLFAHMPSTALVSEAGIMWDYAQNAEPSATASVDAATVV
jgi:hypothetical protein